MTVALIVGLFVVAVVVLLALRKSDSETTSSVDVREVFDRVAPHFRGSFGVCVCVILSGTALLVWAEPRARSYLWLVPILIGLCWLLVQVSQKVKSDLLRVFIYGCIVLPAIITIGPTLPGSTPALPPQYTPDQLRELANMHTKCNVPKRPITFTKEYTYIDREGLCLPTIWAAGKCIYIRDEFNSGHGPFCDGTGASTINHVITAVRSADETFSGYYELKPNYNRLSFRYAGN